MASLVRSGDLSIATALALVPVFASDPSRPVVEIVQGIVERPSDLLVSEAARPSYRRFVSDVFGTRARELGWTRKAGEDDDTQLLRRRLVPFVADEGDDPALVAEAMRLAKAWLKDRSAVDPLMVSGVLGVAARHGDMALFQAYVAEAKKASDRRERRILLDALGQFRAPSVVSAALALTLSTDFDARESIDILWAEGFGRETFSQAWAFLVANFDRLAERLPRDAPADFPWLATNFSDEAHRAEAEAFFREKAPKYAGGPRMLAQALEVIQLRTAFKAAQQKNFDDFLKRYEPKPTIEVKPVKE